MCFLRRSRLPFGRPQKPQTPPQAYMPQPCVSKGVQSCRLPAFKLLNRPASLSKATTFQLQAPAMCFLRRSRLPFGRPQKPQTPPQAYMPQPCVSRGVQGCRLPVPQACPRQALSQLQAPAMCFLRRSRLPFGRPQSPQTSPQDSTGLHASAMRF